MRRDADLTQGIEQCPYVTHHGEGGYLHCRFEVGHDGEHADHYEGGQGRNWGWFRGDPWASANTRKPHCENCGLKAAECVCAVNRVYERRLQNQVLNGLYNRALVKVMDNYLKIYPVVNTGKVEDAPNRSRSQLESAKTVVADLSKSDQQALYEFMHASLGCRIYER